MEITTPSPRRRLHEHPSVHAPRSTQVKGKIEEALANYVPPKRKHLRVYVRMIMTMLRMQKGAKEKKIQRAKQDDDLPDPDDIELFGDFDEGALAASPSTCVTPSTRC